MGARREITASWWLVAFIALAIAWTWPLAAHLTSRIPHDPGNSVLSIWLLWWNAHVMPFTPSWWSPPFFSPVPGALALSEHLAGLALITTPLQWFGGSPLAAYNVAFVLSFALSGFFAFVLVRRLLRGHHAPAVRNLAALTAGVAYGCCRRRGCCGSGRRPRRRRQKSSSSAGSHPLLLLRPRG
jgi:hypothetical protein